MTPTLPRFGVSGHAGGIHILQTFQESGDAVTNGPNTKTTYDDVASELPGDDEINLVHALNRLQDRGQITWQSTTGDVFWFNVTSYGYESLGNYGS